MAESVNGGDVEANGVTTITTTNEDEDPELSELLDSVLDDFDRQDIPPPVKVAPSKQSSAAQVSTKTPTGSASSSSKSAASGSKPSSSNIGKPADGLNFEDYSQVDDVLKKFMDEDPILKQHWEQMANSCAQASSQEDFEASLTSTLKNLSEKAKSLAEGDGDGDGQLSEEELAKLWSQMGLGQGGPGLGGGAGGQLPGGAGMLPDIMPLVTNMMQNLLSKDILYPALTDLSAKYPGWLEENKDNLSEEELTKYVRQLDLMKQVVHEFDSESSSDDEKTKSERFQRILQVMQKMQELGSPPKDLVGDVPDLGMPDFADIASKIPGFSGAPGAGGPCCIQ